MNIIPKTKEELKRLIQKEIQLYGNTCDLNHIDTSFINNMDNLFFNSIFNGNINQWNVSNVKDMSWMFYNSEFNENISQWNVSKVTDMDNMFTNSKFNGDLSNWKPINLKECDNIFKDSICQIPYWYSENIQDIKELIKKYRKSKELDAKLNKELIIQDIKPIKMKI